MPTDRDAVKVRLEATRDATSRSRFALLASTVAALSFLIAEFNAYISWNRDFALAKAFSKPDTPTGIAQRRLLDDWVSSSSMNIPLLGIHVSASDATILGGVALFFLTLWLYYSVRRENRLVGTPLRDTRDEDLGVMDLAFSGIISYMVFTAINPDKPAIDTLSNKPPRHPTPRQSFWGVQLLLLLPPLAIFVSLVFDIISIFVLEAPFRENHQIPIPEGSDLAKIMAYTSVGVLCCGATIVNSYRVRKFDRATGKILREYDALLHAKLELTVRFKESRDNPKIAVLPKDHYGIECAIILDLEIPARIEFRIDRSDERLWQYLLRDREEISAKHLSGRIDFISSETEIPHMIELTSTTKENPDEEIRYSVRELFRMKRYIHSCIAARQLIEGG
jgi:hypothetical protein